MRANTLVLAVAACAAAGVVSGLASDWLSPAPFPRAKLAQTRESDRPLQEGLAQQATREACRRIAEEVAEGRLPLAEGVGRLRALNARRPPWGRIRLDDCPGRTEDERLGRHLIRCVEALLRGDSRRQTTLAALERQFEDLLALLSVLPADGRDLPPRQAGCGRRRP
jgi:hypothetical protein